MTQEKKLGHLPNADIALLTEDAIAIAVAFSTLKTHQQNMARQFIDECTGQNLRPLTPLYANIRRTDQIRYDRLITAYLLQPPP